MLMGMFWLLMGGGWVGERNQSTSFRCHLSLHDSQWRLFILVHRNNFLQIRIRPIDKETLSLKVTVLLQVRFMKMYRPDIPDLQFPMGASEEKTHHRFRNALRVIPPSTIPSSNLLVPQKAE
jgi:hypothetical protein